MARLVTLGDARVLGPGKLRWLRALGWMVLVGALVIFSFGLIGGGFMGIAASRAGIPLKLLDPSIILLATILAALVATSLYAALVRWGEKREPDELKLRFLPAELPLGLLIGAAMQAAAVGLLWLGGWVTISAQPITHILTALDDTVQSGVMEEVLFRLVILRLVWRAFGPGWALAISAAFFGAAHLSNPNSNWFAAVCIAVEAGIMLASFYILTGRIWVSMGVHAGWNFTQGWIFGAAVSGTAGFAGGPLTTQPVAGAAAWLSGGAFGPEASLAGLLVGTVVGVAVLKRAYDLGRMGKG
ncbi:CPBP family intramembrane metalloprotease [Stakelama sediminis]|uniref:CAAX prenyl protease 2/Lysostaphin resistance protein A-like domain-containing protein n=1 Tax=Stakelama sediminis TaxID=463200 RepID=A0A840Z1V7_9SPHN|nr:type II CAAX endopeptidase family protein [Stakelama sediminis]MBB5719696.1 hypothetical protein [Stakelama sediminis]